jgi:hypothetical protein
MEIFRAQVVVPRRHHAAIPRTFRPQELVGLQLLILFELNNIEAQGKSIWHHLRIRHGDLCTV